MKNKMKPSYTMVERSKSEKMKSAQSQSDCMVGEVTTQEGKSISKHIFKYTPEENNTQKFGEKMECR